MIFESRDDVFFENVFPYKRKEDKTLGKRIHEIEFRDERPSKPTVNAEVKTRSKRSRISKSFGPGFITYAVESKSQTFKEVMSTP